MLAVPAFATLISEPLLLMADSAIIGHLGTPQLAALGLAGSVLHLVNGLCIFLAYGTTAAVARLLGAGNRRSALANGLDGMVLAVLLGVAIAGIIATLAHPILALYGADPSVTDQAAGYLRISALGVPALLIMLASTGVLRGLQDTTTPLKVAVTINLANIGLNFALVYGVGLGLIGSALGTVASQYLAAGILSAVVIRGALAERVRLRFYPAGILRAATAGFWLMLRTLSLQAAIITTTVVASHTDAAGLAAHQIANSVWNFLAMALDAIAIAAQAIIGRYLGAGDAETARELTRTMVRWGIWGGIVTGVVLVLVRPLLGWVFTPDPQVQALLVWVLVALAVSQPVAGVVFVLDGVLIGAGDARYLALAGVIALVCYLPFAILVDHADAGVAWLWAAYGIYMSARMATLVVRARGGRWMRLGASTSSR